MKTLLLICLLLVTGCAAQTITPTHETVISPELKSHAAVAEPSRELAEESVSVGCIKVKTFLEGTADENTLFTFQGNKPGFNRPGLVVLNGWLDVWSKDPKRYQEGKTYLLKVALEEAP